MSTVTPRGHSSFQEEGSVSKTEHFEHELVGGEDTTREYNQYLADHHICELFLGDRNWREYATRFKRLDRDEPISSDVSLLLEQDLVLQLSHQFSKLSADQLGNGLTGIAAGAIEKIVSGAAAVGQAGYQAFQGAIKGQSNMMIAPMRLFQARFFEKTEPLSFNFTFNFRMGQYGKWDAREEVFDPIMTLLLMSAPIRKEGAVASTLETPGPSLFGAIGSLGRTLIELGIAGGEDEDNFYTAIQRALQGDTSAEVSGESLQSVTFVVGLTSAASEAISDKGNVDDRSTMNAKNMLFISPANIESLRVSFSKQKDMRGYPAAGTVDMTIQTTMDFFANDITDVEDF